MRIFIVVLAFTLAQNAFARQAAEPVAYELDVTFFPEESRMQGRATVTFDAVAEDERTFYLHGELRVDSLSTGAFGQRKVRYDYSYSMLATQVTVTGHTSPTLTVYYSGYFHPSKARSASDYMHIGSRGVFLRSYGYSLWFPVFLEDHDDAPRVTFTHVTLRTPQDFTTVFVGERLSDTVQDGMRVSEWRAEDVSLFDAQCTASRFTVVQQGSYFIYALPDGLEAAPKVARFAEHLIELMRTYYRSNVVSGQVHIAEMPRYGDISSGNVVGLSAQTWHEFEASEYAQRTLAHEFVHPFVSVATAPGDPIRALVIEGFPSYFHLPVMAEVLGEAYYEAYLNRVQRIYQEKRATGKGRRGGTLPPEKPLTSLTDGDIGVYKDRFVLSDRALLFFDYLRRGMGREAFFRFAQELFSLQRLDMALFERVVLAHLPKTSEDIRVWLETSEYPERFKR